ncbi:MAG: ATP-binding protein [Erysipelotrichaceae bacterium]|nr:ATP-binding protein [Erysipelotrichaceae bacterium]
MINRTIRKYVVDSLDLYPVVVITGARQVGKSTLAASLVEEFHFNYVSLDDIDNRRMALEDPKMFIQYFGYPLIIDEAQYALILFEVIESICNNARIHNEKSTGLFIITGSQIFQMMKGVSQSLAGRATIINMSPLSSNEIRGTNDEPFVVNMDKMKKKFEYRDVHQIFQEIQRGYFPELYNRPGHSAEKYYSDYVTTYIDRDISEIVNVKDKLKFHNFMQILASLTAQQINYASLSKEVEVSAVTIKQWLSVLQASGIIFLLQPYNETSIKKRVVKSPKVYFVDTGLACYLAKLKDSESLLASNFAGAFMETYVVNEIRKSYLNNNKEFDAYYYRDNNQNEIDLIMMENAQLTLVEIKKGVSFDLKDVSAFQLLKNSQYKIKESCILCNTEKNYPLSSDVFVMSVNVI